MKKLIFIITILSIITIASAYSFETSIFRIRQEPPLEKQEIIETRYPIEDYRHGYTYRATEEYQRKYYQKEPPKESYYYREISFLRNPIRVKCYNQPPKDKLFYIRCPS
jgi:uncharacterized protein YxeA